MAKREEINQAIGAHGVWKQRLRQSIRSGNSELTPAETQSETLCEFGKWLHSLPPEEKACQHWKTVQDLHLRFHLEAARVLALATTGDKEEAEKALVGGFSDVSARLTSSMMKWRSHLSR